MTRPPLVRASDDSMIAGVCAGLASHLGLPVNAVRIGTLVLTLLGGAGALLYLWLWALVPRAGETEGVVPLRRALTRPADGTLPANDPRTAQTPRTTQTPRTAQTPRTTQTPLTRPNSQARVRVGPPDPDRLHEASQPPSRAESSAQEQGSAPRRRSRWPIAELLLGACLLVAGMGFVLVRLGVQIQLELILPAMAVLVGVGLTWWQIADRDRPDRNQVPRVLGALALVAAGVLMFFVTAREPNAWTVVAAAGAVLAGVALAIAPWLLRLNRELMAERAARAREAERSDIAAHLHDSVLQTLALIQQRSEPGSEVARIARGQERELRDWLFRAADGAPAPHREAAGEELRAHAAALETDHAVRFEVVEVGSSGVAPEAIVAAAREAMLNAARHAGGDVTVYVEATGERISIDVTDRGPGLDPEDLPPGRMGVRESILGRMERAGGTAKIVAGPGGGASVRLGISRESTTDESGTQSVPASEGTTDG
ncbi:ATP-binding protein [Leucobacter luti]|uniref:ATP-binding protein n=1 Tax=Leucobacter luti TaxID=340320 RepID=UPI001C692C9F|nr:ATP-binding protein [Leucobacter luti]QYM75264.1 PspC domain-containing protein [Leucobacter luti]